MTNIPQKTAYISREEKNGITPEFLKELFDYREGLLYWKSIRKGVFDLSLPAGSIASIRKKGIRRIIGVNNDQYLASRLIFLWHHGYLPEVVDHENRNCCDDRIENLRAADFFQNARNVNSHKDSSSIYLGVSFMKKNGKWEVKIWVNGKSIFLGIYSTQEEGALAYNRAAVKYHGEFANLNIIQNHSTMPLLISDEIHVH